MKDGVEHVAFCRRHFEAHLHPREREKEFVQLLPTSGDARRKPWLEKPWRVHQDEVARPSGGKLEPNAAQASPTSLHVVVGTVLEQPARQLNEAVERNGREERVFVPEVIVSGRLADPGFLSQLAQGNVRGLLGVERIPGRVQQPDRNVDAVVLRGPGDPGTSSAAENRFGSPWVVPTTVSAR